MWRVIQVTETGEEFCQGEFRAEGHANFWIEENAENYPESTFYVEKE
jgi:hypothetical protein